MIQPDLDDLARRPARYWTIDGLPELVLGALWVIWGGAWLLGQQLPHDWRGRTYWLVVPAVLALGTLAANAITRALKRRVSFPRAGYVEWRGPDRTTRYRAGAAIVAAAVLLAIVTLSGGAGDVPRRMPAVLSVILALGFVAISIRQRTPHHLALAGAAAALAVAVTVIATGADAINWLFLGLGTACLLVGGVRLGLFLRTHPPAAAEQP
jgi:hypothetical protein